MEQTHCSLPTDALWRAALFPRPAGIDRPAGVDRRAPPTTVRRYLFWHVRLAEPERTRSALDRAAVIEFHTRWRRRFIIDWGGRRIRICRPVSVAALSHVVSISRLFLWSYAYCAPPHRVTSCYVFARMSKAQLSVRLRCKNCVLLLQRHVNIVIVECYLDSVDGYRQTEHLKDIYHGVTQTMGYIPDRAIRRYEITSFVYLRGHPIKSPYQMNV